MERIEERMAPYKDKMKLPENLDFRELAREWKYADFLKQKGQV